MRTVIIFLLLLISHLANAQEDKANNIQLYYGVGHIMRQDLNVSSMIHEKLGVANLALKYSRENKIDQEVYLKFAYYNPSLTKKYTFFDPNSNKGSFSSIPHQFYLIDLNYSLGKQVLKTEDIGFTIGGRFRNKLNLSFYDFGTAGQTFYYFNSGLDLWLRFKYVLNDKHQFEVSTGVPVFAYVARSPYLGQDSEYLSQIMSHNDLQILAEYLGSGSLQSWGKTQVVDLDLSYRYRLNSKWSIGGTYWFVFSRNTTSTQLIQFENTLYFTTTLNF